MDFIDSVNLYNKGIQYNTILQLLMRNCSTANIRDNNRLYMKRQLTTYNTPDCHLQMTGNSVNKIVLKFTSLSKVGNCLLGVTKYSKTPLK